MASAPAIARNAPQRLPRWAMAWPALTWWIVFFVIPLAWIVIYSFGAKPEPGQGTGPVTLAVLSFDNYAAALSDVFFRVFQITMRTAGLGTLLCAIVGFPVAYAQNAVLTSVASLALQIGKLQSWSVPSNILWRGKARCSPKTHFSSHFNSTRSHSRIAWSAHRMRRPMRKTASRS